MQTVILLIGNPNAGKSTLFNRVTGGHAKVGNWHGVTVGVMQKRTVFDGKEYTVCDLPGIYALESMSGEEAVARDFFTEHGDAVVVFVSECATLARCLPLFYRVTRGRQAMLVLTKRRQFEREGGKIDASLGLKLGIPVLYSESGRAFKKTFFSSLSCAASPKELSLETLYTPVREGLSKADRLLTSPLLCFPLFFFLLLFAFALTFAPHLMGDVMKGGIEDFFSFLASKCEGISSPVLRSLLSDGILKSLGGVLCFLPQIALLYLFLILMEESGLLSRLAYLTDGTLTRIGLNGRAVFSLLMGFGCTAAAILTTRGLDDKRMQRRAIYALAYIPCSAKLPVFLTIASSFFENPFPAVLVLYALGTALCFLALLLMRQRQPLFLMELAPLQLPRPLFVLKSLLFQLRQFIIKTATVILAFLLASWLLSSFDFSFRLCAVDESMLAALCGGLKWIFAPVGMDDWRIAYAALSGLVAKENVAGALSMFFGGFPYSFASGLAFAMFLLTCSPCVSAVASTAKEAGPARAALYFLIQNAVALLLCYITYFLARGGWAYLLPALCLPAALLLVRRPLERIYRKRRDNTQNIHRQHLRAGVLLSENPSAGAGGARERTKDGEGRPSAQGRRRVLLHDARAGGETGV